MAVRLFFLSDRENSRDWAFLAGPQYPTYFACQILIDKCCPHLVQLVKRSDIAIRHMVKGLVLWCSRIHYISKERQCWPQGPPMYELTQECSSENNAVEWNTANSCKFAYPFLVSSGYLRDVLNFQALFLRRFR